MIYHNLTLKIVSISLGLILIVTSGCTSRDKSTTVSPTPLASKTASSTALQLSFQKSLLVRKTSDGKVVPVENGAFKIGEDVNFVFLNVGKFNKGSDGKNWVDMDMSVKDASGKTIVSKQSLLGNKGKTILKDNIAASPYGTVNTSTKLAAGTYQITLVVYDRVSGTNVSDTKSFTLK